MKDQHNYLALKKLAVKLKSELSILDYFFSLERSGLLKFEGRVGKEYFFGFLDQRSGSIALNPNSNVWFDHSSGRGGDIIEAVQVYENLNFAEAIKKLTSNTPIEFSIRHPRVENKSPYNITREIDITHPALKQYVISRGLDLEGVTKFCKEIHWTHKDNAYFGIGLKNDRGGWSVRSKLFKGNLLSAGISTIQIGDKIGSIKIFEGTFDFLSFLKLFPQEKFLANILNSTANFSTRLMEDINNKSQVLSCSVDLYLDSDEAGNRGTEMALGLINAAKDRRNLYNGYSDLNEWLQKSLHNKKINKR